MFSDISENGGLGWSCIEARLDPCSDLEAVVRQSIGQSDSEPVRHHDLVEALVSGLPAKQRAKALRRRGDAVAAAAGPQEAPASGLAQETGHMWHARKVSEVSRGATACTSVQVLALFRTAGARCMCLATCVVECHLPDGLATCHLARVPQSWARHHMRMLWPPVFTLFLCDPVLSCSWWKQQGRQAVKQRSLTFAGSFGTRSRRTCGLATCQPAGTWTTSECCILLP